MDNGFSIEQVSTFFSIIKATHEEAIAESPSMQHVFSFFKELVFRHSVERPPYSVAIFDAVVVKQIVDYMLNRCIICILNESAITLLIILFF